MKLRHEDLAIIGKVKTFSRISVSCSFKSGPVWSWNWTREPSPTSSTLNLSSVTVSDLQECCCKIIEGKKTLEIASSRISYPAQLVLGCFPEHTNSHQKISGLSLIFAVTSRHCLIIMGRILHIFFSRHTIILFLFVCL